MGEVVGEVSCRIAQVSRAISSLCDSVFTALETKMMVYQSVVLGVLLYGAETWAPPNSWLLSYTSFTSDVFVVS